MKKEEISNYQELDQTEENIIERKEDDSKLNIHS